MGGSFLFVHLSKDRRGLLRSAAEIAARRLLDLAEYAADAAAFLKGVNNTDTLWHCAAFN
jgi:hypothetical protein